MFFEKNYNYNMRVVISISTRRFLVHTRLFSYFKKVLNLRNYKYLLCR